jgi:glycosyltransferase involved in cell wall biosynthesis
VVTGVGDLGRLAREKGIGLVATDQPESLAQAALALLDDQALAEALGRQGRRVAEEELSLTRLGEHLDALYQHVLGQNSPSRPQQSSHAYRER